MQNQHLITTLLITGFFCCPAFAQPTTDEMVKRMEAMETRIQELEARLAKYEGHDQEQQTQVGTIQEKITAMETRLDETSSGDLTDLAQGIEIGAGATMIYQFTDHANGDALSQNGEDSGDASYSMELEFSKELDSGLAYMLLETGDGAGVEDELKTFSNVNYDADDSDNQIQVTELWYDHNMGPASLTFGKIDASNYIDTNNYANDETTQFLGRMFRNSPTIEFPGNAAGARLNWNPNARWNMEALVMDGDSDWEDLLDQTFTGAQAGLSPNLFDRDGQYRVLGWLSNRDHTKWNDATNTNETAYGFGFSADQALTDRFGIFARYAWQDPDVFLNGEDFSLEHSYSIGAQLNGAVWNRADDVIGLAFGQIMPSDHYKNSGAFNAKTESHLELYYNYALNENVHISPDVHIIWNPYGGDATNGDNTILVGGIRSQVNF